MNSLGLPYPGIGEAELLNYFTQVANAITNHDEVE
jgi:hypothetical protein